MAGVVGRTALQSVTRLRPGLRRGRPAFAGDFDAAGPTSPGTSMGQAGLFFDVRRLINQGPSLISCGYHYLSRRCPTYPNPLIPLEFHRIASI
jgi:hypothetical protein